MQKFKHKGYAIVAEPNLSGNGTWQISFHVEKERDPKVSSGVFEMPVDVLFRDEAVRWCHQAGKELIDYCLAHAGSSGGNACALMHFERK